jgi:hypothetical protein
VAEAAFAAEDTIFAQFESKHLKECLETCAAALDKKIVWGRSDYPDLLATPAFVVVIDRRVIDPRTYDHYLEMVKECNAHTHDQADDYRVQQTCIILDGLGDRDVPDVPAVLHLDPLNPLLDQWLDAALALSALTCRSPHNPRL